MKYTFVRFPEGKYKVATFSYDDGKRTDKKLAEILTKYGMKGTFNLCGGDLGEKEGEGNLTPNEIKKYLLDNGHEIAVHGFIHKAAPMSRSDEFIKDTLDCRVKLEETFQRVVKGLAYADSRLKDGMVGLCSKEDIKRDVKRMGLSYARTLGDDNDNFALPTDFFAWMPTAHQTNSNTLDWAKEFASYKLPNYCASRESIMFYLWGHSDEYERNNNWDLLENIGEIFSSDSDIWFATNIEICDYITAFNRLEFSADGKIVHNPTAVKIWFEYDKKLFSVESGQTIRTEE